MINMKRSNTLGSEKIEYTGQCYPPHSPAVPYSHELQWQEREPAVCC